MENVIENHNKAATLFKIFLAVVLVVFMMPACAHAEATEVDPGSDTAAITPAEPVSEEIIEIPAENPTDDVLPGDPVEGPVDSITNEDPLPEPAVPEIPDESFVAVPEAEVPEVGEELTPDTVAEGEDTPITGQVTLIPVPVGFLGTVEPTSQYTTALMGDPLYMPYLRNYGGYYITGDFGGSSAFIDRVDFWLSDGLSTYAIGSSSAPAGDGLFHSPNFNPCAYLSLDGYYSFGATCYYGPSSYYEEKFFMLDTVPPRLLNQEVTDIGYHTFTVDEIVVDGTYPFAAAKQIGSAEPVDSVWMQWGIDTSYGSQAEVHFHKDPETMMQVFDAIHVSSLQAGTTYHYRFGMLDLSHNVGYSQDFTVTTLAYPAMEVTANGGADSYTTAMVEANVNMSAWCTLYYGADPLQLNATAGPELTDADYNVSFRVENLQPGTTYYYEVVASSTEYDGLQTHSGLKDFATGMPPEANPAPVPSAGPGAGSQLPLTGSGIYSWLDVGALLALLGLLLVVIGKLARTLEGLKARVGGLR